MTILHDMPTAAVDIPGLDDEEQIGDYSGAWIRQWFEAWGTA
jgi:hypothetical protein